MNKLITATAVAAMLVSAAAQANQCGGVWTGKIERLRTYDQGSNQRVMAYVYPGDNSSFVGYSTSDNMIKTLFAARADVYEVTGYSGTNCKIQWLDY